MSSPLGKFIYQSRLPKATYVLNLPEIRQMVDETIGMIYPQKGCVWFHNEQEVTDLLQKLSDKLAFFIEEASFLEPSLKPKAKQLATDFFAQLPDLARQMDLDAEAAFEGDPAATSVEEVILAYPGFYAICVYRLAHALVKLNIPLIPRIFSEYAHEKTGIDIHPGAMIQERLFIDHGTGVVIGETSHIGKNVKIYQGVTLGALSVKKRYQNIKRHPTIEDGVVIYANTTILGGETVVGEHSVIGGNVWLTASVPRHSVVFSQQTSPQIDQVKSKS